MNPKLSVIIPVYNAGKYIDKCLESVLTQSLSDIECIVIDDGSSDDSIDRINEAVARHPKSNVRLIIHDKNRGLAYTRAEGLRLATGEYVIHCDSDDWVDPDFYREMYTLAKREDADIVVGDFIIEEDTRRILYQFPLWRDWDAFYRHPRWEFLAIWAHMIRRQFLIDNGLDFYPDVNYAEDYGLLFRCYYYSKKNAVYSGDSFYHYSKQNVGSMTGTKYKASNLISKARCLQLLSDFVAEKGLNPMENTILTDEKRVVKEGFLMSVPRRFDLWRRYFPEITPLVVRDSNLGLPYRLCWWLGQHVHPLSMKLYINASGLSKR